MFDPFAGIDATLFVVLGEPATYTPVSGSEITVQIVVTHDVERYTEAGIIERLTEVDLLVSEVAAPRRNDTIATATESFKVDRVLSRDKYVVKVAVR